MSRHTMDTTTKAKERNNSRKKLMAAARELFMKYGVDRVSVRDIATHSGVNLSLMNYYFQSKENLLNQIFGDAIKNIAAQQRAILDSDQTLEKKIQEYINSYIDALIKEPLLVSFVLSILHRFADKASDLDSVGLLYSTDKFAQQIRQEAEMGMIRPFDPEHLYINMLSLILFPFSIKDLIQHRTQTTEADMRLFLEERRAVVYNTVMASIKL
ncbi:MAG: TetR/AcrR family transcriptional regulator [Bacteroidales bacterium]|nr:TetR/AcrR family transcriptional regulator [Bacteroidales bacterium]